MPPQNEQQAEICRLPKFDISYVNCKFKLSLLKQLEGIYALKVLKRSFAIYKNYRLSSESKIFVILFLF